MNGRCVLALLLATLTLLSVGCASVSGQGQHPQDPYETTNRQVSDFNDSIDRSLLKPVATQYKQTVPEVVQSGVKNVFGNLTDIWSTANNAMQLKPMETAETGLRAAVNSVFGIYGLIDWGTRIGLQRHNADFGHTLGYWGVPSGPFVVLPIFGPSNVRDTVGLVVDMDQNLWSHVDPTATRYTGTALRVIDKRAEFLGMDKQLDQLALDKYAFIRDAYLQRRKAQTQRVKDDKDRGYGPVDGIKEERYDQ
jgi:phospholipid-binding lipoprotein MlaA